TVAGSVAGRVWWMLCAEPTLYAWAFRLDALGVGAVIALLPLGRAPRAVKYLGLLLPVTAVVGIGLASQALDVGGTGMRVEPGWTAVVALIPTAVAVCSGAALWAAESVRWLCWRPFIHLGQISYGLYLVHGTALRGLAFLAWPWCGVLSLALSVALAEVS